MILPNLRRALFARCYWKNQTGQKRFTEDVPPLTYNNEPFDPAELVPIGENIHLTRLEQCQRLGGPDSWTFFMDIEFPRSSTVTLQGDHALKVWKAWKGVVYNTKA